MSTPAPPSRTSSTSTVPRSVVAIPHLGRRAGGERSRAGLAFPGMRATVACDAEREPLPEVPPDDSSFRRHVPLLRC